MLRLKAVLMSAGITQGAIASAIGISRPALADIINHDAWPRTRDRSEIEAGIRAFLTRNGQAVDGVFEVEAPRCSETPPDSVARTNPGQPTEPMEEAMLIRKQCLRKGTLGFFGLGTDALMPPVCKAEVFLGGEMRVSYEHMLAKASYGGLIALAGESGAGKTTLKDLLVTELSGSAEVVVIEPHTQAMEASDKAGKTLKSMHICEAILREVAPLEKMKASSEARLNQVETALAASMTKNQRRRHLLVIDEAHALPIPTLRHLKRFLDMRVKGIGLQRPLLSIVLLGQPELILRLSPFDMEVREVWQRCELVTLPPLNRELEAYLKFRLGTVSQAFTPAALDTLRAKLTAPDKRSFLYPLAVDNWVAAILNLAADLGAKQITGDIVDETARCLQQSMKEGL